MSIKAKDMTMAERKERVAQLVKQFKENEPFYLSKNFVESEVRNKFIDPLLECLKWDVKNEKGARHDRQEVITEDRVVMNGQVKHPDYTLCYGGERKMYVEAKQPSVDLKTNPEPALQVRRYAYTSKMPIAVLTDFQELAIYDTRIKPSEKDTAATARIEYLTYDQLSENFESLYDKISWDAVDLGKFDTYYEGTKDKRGTATVDDDILNMIEKWRMVLAEDIALHNDGIDAFNLTGAVQKIIDRLLFLRICEDKEIEEGNQLKKIAEQKTAIYKNVQRLFENANAKFNAGLFASDQWLDELAVADKTLISIINALYYPECQYEFSVLPVEILGSIYERFLGKIIRFTRKTKNGHSIEILEKPEVQKAGGVYYTPPYIVKYIVENTIGKKLAGRTPDDVSRLRFVDPACGSGSFLVGVYQYLLDWHLDWYYAEARRAQAEKKGFIYKDAATKEYKLSVEEKKRILLNNIYGVDIDAQAVEVTKLSLFLKLLENEGKALSPGGQSTLFKPSEIQKHKKILPDMSHNIKCGNSLIGTDYYTGKDLTLFGIEEQRKVNAFDWDAQFPGIFADGGFDCVIGNPPYVLCQPGTTDEPLLNYYKFYKVASYKIDLFHLFFEKAIMLLADQGMLGFITPNTYLTNKYIKPLRQYILHCCDIERLVIHDTVFATASVDVATIILSKQKEKDHAIIIEKEENQTLQNYRMIIQRLWEENTDFLFNINQVKKMEFTDTVPLGAICNTYFGIQAFDRKASISFEKIDDNYLPIIDGEDIFSFALAQPKKFFDYRKQNIKSGGDWNVYSKDRIVVRQIGSIPIVGLCKADILASNTLYSIWSKTPDFSLLYILCILNSKLIKNYWSTTYSDNKLLFPKIKGYQLKELPIKKIPLQEQTPLIRLAEQMFDAHDQLNSAISDSDKKFLQQRVDILDKQINTVVYGLYGLKADDVKTVEN